MEDSAEDEDNYIRIIDRLFLSNVLTSCTYYFNDLENKKIMTNGLLASAEDETSEDHKENRNDYTKKTCNLFVSNPNVTFSFGNEKKILPKRMMTYRMMQTRSKIN